MKTRKLKLYKNGKHFQTVIFQKSNEIVGWSAVNFDPDKYMPFNLHDSIELMKKSLIEEQIEWKWE